MIRHLNGQHYHSMIDYGIRNLALYRDKVNDLNVFPVPDGDTGTNMVMTMQNGFASIRNSEEELSSLSRRFASAVVLGARGNSGVIISQFFKGFSEAFFDCAHADCGVFVTALEQGVSSAYRAVATPVEGTVLTVLRESACYVKAEYEKGSVDSINKAIESFLEKAYVSLENTPELLPILKSAGVVDSGGAGAVYLFEGMKKYFNNETIAESSEKRSEEVIDYTRYNSKSEFPFGYCTELLIQLTDSKAPFDYLAFGTSLASLGESIVTAHEGDKVKVHIHTFTPEKVLSFCHTFGEFLSLKIENMSVQHHEREENLPAKPEFSLDDKHHRFAILAVAHDPSMKEPFSAMGADIVMTGDRHCPPAASDFLAAFEKAHADTVFVFPNNKNTRLAAEQAMKLTDKVRVTVLNTSADSECYAILPMVDFEAEDMESLAEELNGLIDNITTAVVTKATKNGQFDGKEFAMGDYVGLVGQELLAVETTLAQATQGVLDHVMSREVKDVITVFATAEAQDGALEEVLDALSESYPYTEVTVIDTQDPLYPIVLSFE